MRGPMMRPVAAGLIASLALCGCATGAGGPEPAAKIETGGAGKPGRKTPTPGRSLTRSSAAEYLTFVAAAGQGGVEAIYADENVWLTQKMMHATRISRQKA